MKNNQFKPQIMDNMIEHKPHHEQTEICSTRAPYRQGRKLTALKVYSINDESNHILIFNVPSTGFTEEIKRLCAPFGPFYDIQQLTTTYDEEFTHTFHVHYKKMQNAKFAKLKLDNKQFYGGVLHVCYAPEMETINETRTKLADRRREVAIQINKLKSSTGNDLSSYETHFKSQFSKRNTLKRQYSEVSESRVHSDMNIYRDPNQPSTSGYLANPYSQSSSREPSYYYPSTEVLQLPGSALPVSSQQPPQIPNPMKFIPTAVRKNLPAVNRPVNRIIFHNKKSKTDETIQ